MLSHMAGFFSFLKPDWCSIVYMYYICFIHSSIDSQLGYFHILAIQNSAPKFLNNRLFLLSRAMCFPEYLLKTKRPGA
jgi:hypothetical protein